LSGGLVEARTKVAEDIKEGRAFWMDGSVEPALKTAKFDKIATASRAKVNTIPMHRADTTSAYSVSFPVWIV
jgi:hypothetical protein